MKIFIFYDIVKNKDRNNIINILFDYSFRRIQYSVFMGNLNKEKDVVTLLELLKKNITSSSDSIILFPVCEEDFEKCFLTSKNLQTFYWGANNFEIF